VPTDSSRIADLESYSDDESKEDTGAPGKASKVRDSPQPGTGRDLSRQCLLSA
jgi:hypothetical protein